MVAAVLQHRSPLALGNVMGSSISNILGAFSLGLLCHPGRMEFDSTAKMYSALLLFVTTLVVGMAVFDQLNQATGGILIALFVVYLISIGYAIYRGIAEPPQMSDSDSDSEDGVPTSQSHQIPPSETDPLLASPNSPPPDEDNRSLSRPLYYHLLQLLFGLLALSLSGYILAHSAGAIADALHLSGTVFGLTVIAFATTLPEKFISVLSGFRGQGGIIVATTAGSNVFLLTLCVGIVAASGGTADQPKADTFVLFDLVTVWVSALLLVAVVFLRPPSRVSGFVLLVAYLVFLVLEFTVYKR